MADNKQINPKKPIPSSGYDRLRDNLTSNFADGFPVNDFPNPDNRANINRGTITTRKDDTVQDVSIGLQDHDEAIAYYFNNVIQPTVVTNGNRIKVPIMYGAPERWKGVQRDGHFRDKEGKLQVPLIMFKRDSVEKRRDLGNKMDANSPQLYYTFQERYTKKNQYDNFSVLMNRKPVEEYHATVIPDYVNISYSCIIWTDYVAQMNKLIEAINYASDSYWGDGERFKFNAKIDTYNNTTEVAQGDNRSVKTNFGLKISGYLVPDSLNKELSKQPQKRYSKAVISFGVETESQPYFKPKTREQVREATGIQNIQQAGIGVGYSTVMGLGQTIGGLPTTSSLEFLYDYQIRKETYSSEQSTTIGSLTGRRFISHTDASGNNNHLQHQDNSLFLPGSPLYPGGQDNFPFRPVKGGEEPVDYPNSNDGFIYSTENDAWASLGAKMTNRITEQGAFTKFLVFYLSHRTTSSFWGGSAVNGISNNYYSNNPGISNPIVTGHRVLSITPSNTGMSISSTSGSSIGFTPSSSMDPSNYPVNNFDRSGNESIRITPDQFDYSSTAPPNYKQWIDCVIPPSQRPQPGVKHLLSVSVDNSTGATRIRMDGVDAFVTGSSVLKNKTFSFDYIGNHSYEVIWNETQNWSFSNIEGFDGVIFETSMVDGYMTDTDVYAMEQIIGTRNGLSI